MANWRKVIVSGSKAELNDISSSGDFVMSKDGAAMKFGNDKEVTLTHVHDNGLLLSDASGIGTTKLNFGDSGTFVQQSSDGILRNKNLAVFAPLRGSQMGRSCRYLSPRPLEKLRLRLPAERFCTSPFE